MQAFCVKLLLIEQNLIEYHTDIHYGEEKFKYLKKAIRPLYKLMLLRAMISVSKRLITTVTIAACTFFRHWYFVNFF